MMDSLTSILTIVDLLIMYIIALALYRLSFPPLAKFPGPKLAAASGWYEFFHDILHRGHFMWHIQDLHDQYSMTPHSCRKAIFGVIVGPIVRVTPHELHVRVSEYYYEIHAASAKKRDKWT